MNEQSRVATELDEVHARARAAFESRDVTAYRELFEPELAYRQADGRVIDRDRLMHDVSVQFRRLSWVQAAFDRERIESSGDRATEILNLRATVGATAFLIVHRTWKLTRKGRYSWRKHGSRWMIEAIEVLEEQVGRGRFTIGLRPPTVP